MELKSDHDKIVSPNDKTKKKSYSFDGQMFVFSTSISTRDILKQTVRNESFFLFLSFKPKFTTVYVTSHPNLLVKLM